MTRPTARSGEPGTSSVSASSRGAVYLPGLALTHEAMWVERGGLEREALECEFLYPFAPSTLGWPSQDGYDALRDMSAALEAAGNIV